MIDKLEAIEEKYEELGQLLSNPEIIGQPREFQKYAKRHSELEDIVMKFKEYKSTQKGITDAEDLLKENQDPDFKEMIEIELDELKEKKKVLEEQIKIALIPKDPNDEKNVIVEIRAGTGGEEAALFAGNLFRMYSRYAEVQGWRTEILSSNPTDIGGFKEISFLLDLL